MLTATKPKALKEMEVLVATLVRALLEKEDQELAQSVESVEFLTGIGETFKAHLKNGRITVQFGVGPMNPKFKACVDGLIVELRRMRMGAWLASLDDNALAIEAQIVVAMLCEGKDKSEQLDVIMHETQRRFQATK